MEQNDRVFRIRHGYVLRSFLDEYIAVPVSAAEGVGRKISILDPVGAFIWQRLEGPGSSFGQLLEAVLEGFEVDGPTASRDIEEFLRTLENDGYLSDETEER